MKRWMTALILAFALAAGAHRVMSITSNPCQFLEPDSWLWWAFGCPGATGGGGSGAGD